MKTLLTLFCFLAMSNMATAADSTCFLPQPFTAGAQVKISISGSTATVQFLAKGELGESKNATASALNQAEIAMLNSKINSIVDVSGAPAGSHFVSYTAPGVGNDGAIFINGANSALMIFGDILKINCQ